MLERGFWNTSEQANKGEYIMGLDDLKKEKEPSSTGTRRYVQPTKEEFEECLLSAMDDISWQIDHEAPANEYVYDTHSFMPEQNGIVLRVFSTIDLRTDKARSKGADAIRLVVWNRHIDAPMGGRKKTLRIETYCKNLTNKIRDIFEEYDRYDFECPECGGWLVLRDGQYGEFYGCSNYPDCAHTEETEDD